MDRSPFIEDARDLLTHHVALAVDSPRDEVRAMHIGAALHHAEVAAGSGLAPRPRYRLAEVDQVERPQRAVKRVIRVAFVLLLIAVVGMVIAGVSLLRS